MKQRIVRLFSGNLRANGVSLPIFNQSHIIDIPTSAGNLYSKF